MQGLPGTHDRGGSREKAESQTSYSGPGNYCHHLQILALTSLGRTHKEQFPCSSDLEAWPRLWPRFFFRGFPASLSPFILFHTRAQNCPRSRGLHSLISATRKHLKGWTFDSSVIEWKWKWTAEAKKYKPVCSSFQILRCCCFHQKSSRLSSGSLRAPHLFLCPCLLHFDRHMLVLTYHVFIPRMLLVPQ